MDYNVNFVGGTVNDSATPPEGVQVLLLTGNTYGTVVKTLQLISGNEHTYIDVIRRDGIPDNPPYATIKVQLKSNDYLLLWQGFMILPYNHTISIKSDSNLTSAVVHYINLDEDSNIS